MCRSRSFAALNLALSMLGIACTGQSGILGDAIVGPDGPGPSDSGGPVTSPDASRRDATPRDVEPTDGPVACNIAQDCAGMGLGTCPMLFGCGCGTFITCQD